MIQTIHLFFREHLGSNQRLSGFVTGGGSQHYYGMIHSTVHKEWILFILAHYLILHLL